MKLPRACAALALALFILHPSSFILAQGLLTPPGVPAPTMKTLDQIEPRTPISALPFTISASGSYYLTANLKALASGNGITINASDVTLDLGGFALVGNGGAATFGIRVSVGRTNVTIRNGTVRDWTGSGVVTENTAVSGVRVEAVRALANGSTGIVLGIGCVAVDCLASGNALHGISTSGDSLVLRCTSRGNTGGDGIQVGARSAVRECVATGNAGDGIQTSDDCEVGSCRVSGNGSRGANCGDGCVVRDCTADGNAGAGIETLTGAVVQACAARANVGIGIAVGNGSTVADSSASANTGTSGISLAGGCTAIGCTANANTSGAATSQGISGGTGCLISRCTVTSILSTNATLTFSTGAGIVVISDSAVEECVVRGNRGDGIRAALGCTLVRNACAVNGTGDGAGIHVTSTLNRIDSNHLMQNDRGIEVDSTANTVVRNTATSNTANYDIIAANSVGAIVNPGSSLAISGNGALASSLTTTDPWANFSE